MNDAMSDIFYRRFETSSVKKKKKSVAHDM